MLISAERMRKVSPARPTVPQSGYGFPLPLPFSLLLVAGIFTLSVRSSASHQQHTYSELADLHVTALASANPVDVVSSDRHTVKPWFEGKIPFTFNLPELQDSELTLVGGRIAYLGQSPGS